MPADSWALGWDVVVIGAGVIGVAIARELKRRCGGRVLIIEKEPAAGRHASGRNSGVLHSGVYYPAGSLKACLCVEGNRRMRALCLEHGIPMTDKGKVIVARQEGEQAVLEELYRRAQANGVQASLIDEQTLRELEPCARTLGQALYVATTAVVDPERVMEALVAMALREGVAFRYACAWQGVGRNGVVETSQGQISCGHVVNCGGLYADRIAHAYGVGRHYRILPFRGRFYGLRADSTVRVNGNIYPVPDLRNPFLGVHLTRRPNGSVIVGPSTLPVLGREHYAGLQGVTRADAVAMIGYLGRLLSTNPNHFRSLALGELAKLPRLGFYREAARLVDGLKPHDLLPGPAPGIRAQLVDTRTAKLVSDFVVEEGPRSTHVLNAVSPAFTCALPFAEYVVDLMTLGRGTGRWPLSTLGCWSEVGARFQPRCGRGTRERRDSARACSVISRLAGRCGKEGRGRARPTSSSWERDRSLRMGHTQDRE